MKTYEEKIAILNRQFEFPCRAVMYLQKEEKQYTVSVSNFRDKKKKLENIRFAEIQAISFGGPITPIYVGDFENADALLKALEAEGDQWINKEVAE